jgi:Uma2 family endonuclease
VVGVPQLKPTLTEAEYLRWENALIEQRHEFVDGEVFAMTGTRKSHNRVVLNLAPKLDALLRDTPCEVFALDVKVRVAAAKAYFYPDIVVSCPTDALTDDDPLVIESPKVIIEVASPSTSDYDLMGKFARYRLSPTLMEYVLISPDHHDLIVHRRLADGQWVVADSAAPNTLELRSIDVTIPFAEIFANVTYVEPPSDDRSLR